jgi:plastocyanin
MRKPVLLLALLVLATIVVSACGGDDDAVGDAAATEQTTTDEATTEAQVDGAPSSGSSAQLSADPNGILAYDATELTATPKNGSIEIDFTNASLASHDVRIEDASGKDVGGSEIISEGEQSVKLDLEPGEYTFFCSVGGHRQAGMEGKLTIE